MTNGLCIGLGALTMLVVGFVFMLGFETGRNSAFKDCSTYGAFYIESRGFKCEKVTSHDPQAE